MKKCPYCAEEIQDDAVKCRYCGEFLNKAPQEKFYLKSSLLIIAFLCVGPLALPLLWINPKFSRMTKIIVTVVITVVSVFLWIKLTRYVSGINNYYEQIFNQLPSAK